MAGQGFAIDDPGLDLDENGVPNVPGNIPQNHTRRERRAHSIVPVQRPGRAQRRPGRSNRTILQDGESPTGGQRGARGNFDLHAGRQVAGPKQVDLPAGNIDGLRREILQLDPIDAAGIQLGDQDSGGVGGRSLGIQGEGHRDIGSWESPFIRDPKARREWLSGAGQLRNDDFLNRFRSARMRGREELHWSGDYGPLIMDIHSPFVAEVGRQLREESGGVWRPTQRRKLGDPIALPPHFEFRPERHRHESNIVEQPGLIDGVGPGIGPSKSHGTTTEGRQIHAQDAPRARSGILGYRIPPGWNRAFHIDHLEPTGIRHLGQSANCEGQRGGLGGGR